MMFMLPGRATRNFLALLVLMPFILFIDRVNLAAAAEVIKEDLGLSNIQLGLAFSAFNYATGQISGLCWPYSHLIHYCSPVTCIVSSDIAGLSAYCESQIAVVNVRGTG